ncbi:MAG: type II toxin-antitoxin system VapC family toxin [Gammaproteobacteria bacterium]|nr:type II toxin-antitoxin system VapC family toxin [Gammaproteobacteria bacterium]MXX05278.1 type II toxin-antitoxin system VapC family toxin [Gammaproteobacteria bacterium]MXY90131.1 type II toxin-antitoxin system VapC family toxin [Gammaproteobacteria bacterium]MXZ33582.1 type II toxin-antitoxin system VapC family toxin [Gammaproteobacteria bacterium]MYA35164.1 type II toxin-antitoxin system VapC family toxin [Gammaproteobacteria bacterium]
MNCLLDTQLLLWAAGDPDRLANDVRVLLQDPQTQPHYSAASIWEVAIKNGLGRPDFRADPRLLRRGLLENGYIELPVTGAHAAEIDLLPPIHKDPFDRLLIAQCRIEGLNFLTTEKLVARYPGPIQAV